MGFCSALAQIETPVKWKVTLQNISQGEYDVVFNGTITKGWHLYSTSMPDGGPTPTSVRWNLTNATLVGPLSYDKEPVSKYDPTFDMQLSWWEDKVILVQRIHTTTKDFVVGGTLTYMSCNDESCTAPQKEEFSLGGEPNTSTVSDNSSVANNNYGGMLWTPVYDTTSADNSAKVKSIDNPQTANTEGYQYNAWSARLCNLAHIFIMCFIAGFIALLTPCVWPMIPLTVGFFLKRNENKRTAISQAFAYGISIIVIYMLLAVVVTALFGASSLNSFSTSAVCNIVFFLMLVFFGLSLIGTFELTLPVSWVESSENTANRSRGLVSIFFMAFTLTLVSFSCTAPIIGTLLVEIASNGSIAGPCVGMFGFSLALAIPFCLFAIFPTALQKLPKSGAWMQTIRVTLGFIELGFSLKFFSVADLAYGWHLLDRNTFIIIWIALSLLLAVYITAKIIRDNGTSQGTINTIALRTVIIVVSLLFSGYLSRGLLGYPLQRLSAFLPPMEQSAEDNGNIYVSKYNDYETGMEIASATSKYALVDFSGYGCVNCRKMEGSILEDKRVKKILAEKFVLIQLMTDDKHELIEPIHIKESDGKETTLLSIGDKWSYLQRYKFNTNSQPYFVILSANGSLLAEPMGYTESADEFIAFLHSVKVK